MMIRSVPAGVSNTIKDINGSGLSEGEEIAKANPI